MTPEAKVKKVFVDDAKKYGLSYINLIETGDDGNPDKIALPPGGVPALIEFKRGVGGVLSDEQKAKIKRYRTLGYKVYVVDSKDEAHGIVWGMMTLGNWYLCDEAAFLVYCAEKYPG